MRSHVFVVILILCSKIMLPHQSLGQEVSLDSLQRALLHTDSKTTRRVDALCKLAFKLRLYDPDSTLIMAREALDLARTLHYQEGISYALYNIGVAYHVTAKYDTAMLKYEEGLQVAQRSHDLTGQSRILNNMGLIFWDRGKFPEALEKFQQSYLLDKELRDVNGQARALNNIGLIYRNVQEFEKALSNFKQSLEILTIQKDYHGIAQCMHNIGLTLTDLGEYREARTYFRSSMDYSIRSGALCHAAHPLAGLAEIHFELGQIDSSIYYAESILDLPADCTEKKTLAVAYYWLGVGMEGSPGLENLQKCLLICRELGLKSLEQSTSLALYKLYKNIGQYQNALEYLEVSKTIEQELKSEQSLQKIHWLESKYEFDKKALSFEKDLKYARVQRNIYLTTTALVILLSVLGIIIIVRIKRKKHEQMVTRNAQLKEIDSLKSRFFINISHELRTPLTMIMGPLCDLISRQNLTDAELELLRIAEENAKKMLWRIDEIMDLSKIDAGKLELKLVPVQVRDAIEQIVQPNQRMALSKDVRLETVHLAAPNSVLMLDRRKFESIVDNLVNNAVKYTSPGGVVNVVVDEDPGLNALRISIRDNGRGIHPRDLPHVFDRHFQSSANQAYEGGYGIGLSLANELAKIMGGSITVTSEWGKGSVFVLQLPLVPATAGAESLWEWEELEPRYVPEPVRPEVAQKKSKGHILLVEDSPDLQDYISSMLSAEAYQVTSCSDGLQALAVLRGQHHSIDLVITDIMMPQMDGFTLIQRIKDDEQLLALPIIALTALINQKDKLKALRVGIDDYITKPFCRQELLLRIKNILKHRAPKAEQSSLPNSPDQRLLTRYDLNWLAQLEEILKAEIDNADFMIPDLADKMAMSTRQLRRRLNTVTGLSPKQYFRQMKLAVAREMLESGEYRTVTEVARRVGFTSAHYFNRVFMDTYGKEPSELLFCDDVEQS